MYKVRIQPPLQTKHGVPERQRPLAAGAEQRGAGARGRGGGVRGRGGAGHGRHGLRGQGAAREAAARLPRARLRAGAHPPQARAQRRPALQGAHQEPGSCLY